MAASTPIEPVWVSSMPAASGLWSMILTCRERGSDDVADNLLAAAEKQWEVHLRTQEIMNRNRSTKQVQVEHGTTRTTRITRDQTKNHRKTEHEHETDSLLENNKEIPTNSSSSFNNQNEILNEKRLDTTVKLEHVPLSTSSSTPARGLSPSSPIESSSSRVSAPDNNNSEDLSCYKCYSSRLKSYEKSKFRWVSPSPSQLSEAGFFFIGPRDKVQCFSCQIRQNQWKPAEDPWVRHTRHSPCCDYIIETRGQDFISTILTKVEKVKNGIINTYTRSNSNSSTKNPDGSEFSKMKLRSTKKNISMSGWLLDPYKERGVGKKKK